MLVIIDHPFASLADARNYIRTEIGEKYLCVTDEEGFDRSLVGNFIMEILRLKGFRFDRREPCCTGNPLLDAPDGICPGCRFYGR